MKKVVILVIGLIYIASVFIVNFFGLEIKIFEGTTYVERIEVESLRVYDLTGAGLDQTVTTARVEEEENFVTIKGKKYYQYDFTFTPAPEGTEYTKDNIEQNPNTVSLAIRVLPDNADKKGVQFIFDDVATEEYAVFKEETNTVIFLQPGRIRLKIKAVDGSEIETKQFYIRMK